MPAYDSFYKKKFCHPERSDGSIIRHASSLCKSANRSFVSQDDKPFKTSILFAESGDFIHRNDD